MGASSRLYGPLAAVAAAVATAVASFEIPNNNDKLQFAPYILYSAHPSMPIPPIASCSSIGCTIPSRQPQIPEVKSRCPSVEQVVEAVSSFVSDSISQFQFSHPQILPQFLMASPAPASNLSMFRSHAGSCLPSSSFTSTAIVSQGQNLPNIVSDYIRSWHSRRGLISRDKSQVQGNNNDSIGKDKESSVTVVLLGWLGAKQKHLKRYADWYNERGINAVTFVIPMRDIIGFRIAGGKAEQQIEHLATHLAAWMDDKEDGKEKHLFFHTFSNTGWLSYGVILETLLQRNVKLLEGIKGCIVDSAPVAQPDPQVWASGFSAALLQKKSITTKMGAVNDPGVDMVVPKPEVTELALHSLLERFFSYFLEIPGVKRRLSEVVDVLSKHQPKCPQLYFYSDADKVIPAKSVESFMEEQRKAGRVVKACNLLWSPHVDHFRSFPDVYSSHLSAFIHECLSRWSFK